MKYGHASVLAALALLALGLSPQWVAAQDAEQEPGRAQKLAQIVAQTHVAVKQLCQESRSRLQEAEQAQLPPARLAELRLETAQYCDCMPARLAQLERRSELDAPAFGQQMFAETVLCQIPMARYRMLAQCDAPAHSGSVYCGCVRESLAKVSDAELESDARTGLQYEAERRRTLAQGGSDPGLRKNRFEQIVLSCSPPVLVKPAAPATSR